MGQGGSTPPSSKSTIKRPPARKRTGSPTAAAEKKTTAARPPRPSKKEQREAEEKEEQLLLAQRNQAELEAQAAAAAAEAELAVFNQCYDEEQADAEGMGAEGTFDPTVTATMVKMAKRQQHQANMDGDEDADIGEVSLHSEDYQDEQLLQGLRDLDDELEADFEAEMAGLREQVQTHKRQALALMKDQQDKEGARAELQKAKALEAELEARLAQHQPPLSVRIEKLQEELEKLREAVAAKKQDSLASLRAGDKPAALEHLKAAKGLEKEVKEKEAQLAKLEEEKAAELRQGDAKQQ